MAIIFEPVQIYTFIFFENILAIFYIPTVFQGQLPCTKTEFNTCLNTSLVWNMLVCSDVSRLRIHGVLCKTAIKTSSFDRRVTIFNFSVMILENMLTSSMRYSASTGLLMSETQCFNWCVTRGIWKVHALAIYLLNAFIKLYVYKSIHFLKEPFNVDTMVYFLLVYVSTILLQGDRFNTM